MTNILTTMTIIPNEEPVLTAISRGTDVDPSEFPKVSQASGSMPQALVLTPKRKRGRPRKNKDVDNLTTKGDLPSGGAPFPLSSRPPEESTAYESAPAASTYGSLDAVPELPFPISYSPASGLPAVYPDPYSKSESPVKAPQHPESLVVKPRRGRPPKAQALDNKQQQDEKSPDRIRTSSSCDVGKDTKRPRGRPKGSVKFKKEMPGASESPPGNFRDALPLTPRVLQIHPEEDVARIVTSFCQKALQPMCVLSATGAVKYIELKHGFPSRGGSLVYQGVREIISMSGYFIPLGVVASERAWSSRFSVALADGAGTVIGGGISGTMIAASKVQVVLGSFTSVETYVSHDSV